MECSRDRAESARAEWERAKAAGEDVGVLPLFQLWRREDQYLVEIDESNAYVHECRAGHSMKMSVRSMRYELLFESGAVAMLVGFNREAVSSFASALERFFEFAIDAYCQRAKVTPSALDATWKLTPQTERQLGAFLFLYVTAHGTAFCDGRAWNAYTTRSKFRNDVIHAGLFPTRDQTRDYAKYVYDLIRETREKIVELDAEAVRVVEHRYQMESNKAVHSKAGPPKPDEDGRSWQSGGSSFPMMLAPLLKNAAVDFDSRLAETKDNLWLWGLTQPQDA